MYPNFQMLIRSFHFFRRHHPNYSESRWSKLCLPNQKNGREARWINKPSISALSSLIFIVFAI
jgi:hypothetical protein